MPTAYLNGPIFDGLTLHHNKALLIADDETFVGIVSDDGVPEEYSIVDLNGQYISPGLIDIQIYGGNGKMFSDEPSVETIEHTYEYCKAGGATHFMITLATNDVKVFYEGFKAVHAYWQKGGKGLLGLHLEGPYLNPTKRGAHILEYIKKPTIEEVLSLLEAGGKAFRMMTLAPECFDFTIVELLQKNGVLVSLGHSNASYEEATEAFNNGIPVGTHLFNAMSGLQHRAPGVVGALFDHPTAKCSLVCDGIHVDFAAARVAKKIMGDRLFYITDAVTHAEEGSYKHLFKGDHYALPDGTLSGSALTMLQSVENGIKHLNISIEESLRMATSYPASLFNKPGLGRFEKGFRSELVKFDLTA